MLIRSQNKMVLMNVDNLEMISLKKDDEKIVLISYINLNSITLGAYSTKEKALKVLDMIQEAYACSEYAKNTIGELVRSYGKAPETEADEEIAEAIGETFKETTCFQMPADNEVEV